MEMKDVGTDERTRIVAVSGEVDSSNAQDFRMQVEALGPRVVLDLSGLTFMDSSGATALLAAWKTFEADGRTLIIVVPSGTSVHEILKLLSLTDTLPLAESRDAARERLATP